MSSSNGGVEFGILPHGNTRGVHTYYQSWIRAISKTERANRIVTQKMIRFLVLALYLKNRDWLNESAISGLMKRYQQILALGRAEEDNFISSETKKKRKKSKTHIFAVAGSIYESQRWNTTVCSQ